MTVSERLLARLRALGFTIPEGTEVHRTYAGRIQRKQGAWSWFLWPPIDTQILSLNGRRTDIGSHFPVTELVRAKRLIATLDDPGSISIDALSDAEEPQSRGWYAAIVVACEPPSSR